MPEWSRLVDIIEDDREYLFKADLPEMKKDDVKVTIENGVLYTSGERKTERKKRRESSIGWNASSAHSNAHLLCRKTQIRPRSWLSFVTACYRFTSRNARCRNHNRLK